MMSFRGSQAAPSQSNHNATAAAAADARHARLLKYSEGEIRRQQDAQFSGGDGAGENGFSSESGEARALNLGWNRSQQRGQERRQRQWEPRWVERRAGRHDGNNNGVQDAPGYMATSFNRGRGWWGGRGEGRFSSSSRGGGREGDWTQNQRSNDWAINAGNGDYRRSGRVSKPAQRLDESRYWCTAENQLPAPHETFVLVSYNILADKNAYEHYNELYYHIPHWILNWNRRKTRLVEELGMWSPDIMCLQEVDKFEDLREEFQSKGYSSAYKGRTGGARDGCAIFWKSSRFRLLQEVSIQFNELGLKDNVAQLCVFQSTAGETELELSPEAQYSNSENQRGLGSLVIIGNIHVLFNPKRGDVKLGQVRVLLESAHALSEKWGGAPVTIAGDFNSTPMSDLYKFLATSELDISCLNRSTMSGQIQQGEGAPVTSMSPVGQDGLSTDGCSANVWSSRLQQSAGADSPNKFVKRWHWTPEELIAASGSSDCSTVRHNLNLRSAYSQIKGEVGCRGTHGEPLVTTFHRKFMGTVDYIWHTEGIDTVKVLDTVPLDMLQRSQGLPTQKRGSDHLALACELAFLPCLPKVL